MTLRVPDEMSPINALAAICRHFEPTTILNEDTLRNFFVHGHTSPPSKTCIKNPTYIEDTFPFEVDFTHFPQLKLISPQDKADALQTTINNFHKEDTEKPDQKNAISMQSMFC